MAESLEGFRLSPQQRRLWRLQEAHGAAPFRARALLRLTGPLSPDDLAAALSRVVAHADILRTAFQRLPGLSLPVQAPDPSFTVRVDGADVHDLEGPPAASDTPLTVRLARLAPEAHLALLELPALCADERSLVNLAGEIAAALTEGEGYAPELLPYSQFAEWQNSLLEDEDAADGRAFWESQGLSAVPPLVLPMAAISNRAGAFAPRRAQVEVEVDLPAGLADPLVCLAAWQVLLGRLTGRDEVVTGLLDDGRGHETLTGALGLFARALPVRAALPPGLPFAELVRRLAEWTDNAVEWAEHFRMSDALPAAAAAAGEPDGGRLRRRLRLAGAAGDLPAGAVTVGIERCTAGCERFDLLLSVVRQDGALRLEVVHDAGRIGRDDAASVGRLFARLLANAAAAPETPLDDLELLGPAERAEVVVAANRTAAPVPAQTLHRLFREQAARTPDRPAVVFGSEEIPFAELEVRSNRLARHLRALGVGPDVPAGLLLERSADWIVALLAVLKAGGAYLPLDPTFPVERLAGILAESGAPVVVTREGLVPSEAVATNGLTWVRLDTDAAAIDARSGDALPADEDRTGPEHLAYILSTSGTTGRPKGVMIRHGAVVNLLAALRQAVYHAPEGTALRVSVNAPFTFDASVKQWIQLLAGATLVLVPEEARPDPEKLLDFVRRNRVDVLDCTPSQLRGLLDAGLAGPGETVPATVLVGGEAIDAATWERLTHLAQEGPTRFYNVYGPTECTVDVTTRPVDLAAPRPRLGLPLANVRCHVVDARLRPVPWWVAGELLVGGAGLARGYLAQPALTAERFVPDPFAADFQAPGARLYRTGDLVRRLPGGELEFLGRRDQQVKIRGFRIELEEIEAALADHPAVRQAAAAVREGGDGPSLAAYVTLAPDAGEEIAGELRAWLRRRLPELMVPGAILPLADLPLTRHGKVDRQALPDPGAAGADRPVYQPPRSEAERTVAAVWQEVLGVAAVGVDDNFFDLGGHSLLMVRAHGRLQEAFGRPISMVEMFRFPTVGSFAAYLSQGAAETVSLAEVRDRADRQRQEQERQRAAMERLREIAMSFEDLRGVAIVGMAGRFPGARDVAELWRNLRAGIESVTFFTEEELRRAGVDPRLLERPDYVRARAVLDDVDRFDAAFFGFTPREAETTDPQQRLFLETAWQALESAGYDPRRCRGPIGVFAGAGLNAYLLGHLLPRLGLLAGHGDAMTGLQTSILNKGDHLTTRVAYELDLRGPAVTVQTACSTSLVATVLACQSLLNYQCDMALAGGVTISLPQRSGYVYQPGGIASPDGHCRAFDARAQGTVDGSGAGVVVLKRLADAMCDGDTILAVLKGAAINNDGAAKAGYTAPGMDSQAEVIATAQALAEVDADTIGYVEAHGTGTPLGDPIEVAALTRAFRLTTERRGFCALGSVKSNFGHLDAAAGIAGLIKATLAVQHGEIPPSLHFETPNPAIDFAASPFFVNSTLLPWPGGPDQPRRAGVSSFGIGGTNAHVVLEEAPVLADRVPATAASAAIAAKPWQLLVLAARSGPALEAATANLADHLRQHPELDLADVAWTLQLGRAVFDHRRALVAASREDAIDALESLDPERVFQRVQAAGHRPVTFLFPGQGAQYPGMGAGLYDAEPVYRREVERCLDLLAPAAAEVRAALFPAEGDLEEAARRLERTEVTQPALFIVEHALARLWMEWGVTPRSFLGHSIGEYVAACLAGVMTLEEALRLVVARGRLIGGLPGGAMLSVSLPERELVPRLGSLSLAAVNGPSLCVVSGPAAAVDELERRLTADGVICRRLHTSHAFHSEMMEPALAAFTAEVRKVRLQPPSIPYLSNLTGTWITAAEATDPEYWARHLRGTVRFAAGLEELLGEPDAVLLEVGPGRTLKTAARWHPGKGPRQVVETSLPHPRERRPDPAFLLAAAGRLWLAGVELDWERLQGGPRRRVPLPTYPFERRRYWIDAPPPGAAGSLERKADLADWFYQPVWREVPAPVTAAQAAGPWLVFAREGGFGERLAIRLGRSGAEVVRALPGDRFERAGDHLFRLRPDDPDDHAALLAALRAAGLFPQGIVHAWCAEEVPEPDEPALDLGFHSLLALARALGGETDIEGLGITVLSSNMQPVTGGESLRPERATLLGPVKVIPREDPRLRCRSVDLASLPSAGSHREKRSLDLLVAEIAAASDQVVAYRSERRWVQDYAPVHLPAEPPAAPPLRAEGVYLITGGLGGVGLEIAESLARSVRARLVLTGRTPLPDRRDWDAWIAAHGEGEPLSRRLRRVQRLEELGAEILTATADVTDRTAMATLGDATRRRFGALHGVIHAAGLPDGGLIQLRSRAASEAIFDAKVRGTRVLAEVIAEVSGQDLDFLVLCSSLSSVVGRLGQVAYGSANAFQDAFAWDHTARTGVYTLAVNWGEWLEVGMAATPLPFAAAVTEATGHPFLETRSVFPDGREVYVTHFGVHRHWLVDEHRLVGNAVVPGVAYFEMLRAAVAERAAGRAIRLTDVVFVAPIQVRDTGTREVQLHLIPDGDGFRFAVRSPPDADEAEDAGDAGSERGGELQDYVVGRLDLIAAAPPRRLDVDEIKRRCNVRHVVWGDEDREDDLGPRWQNVKQAWVGEREVITRLELADELHGDLALLKLHPSLMDRSAGVSKEFLIEGTYLPLTYGRLTLHAEMPPRLYTYGRLRHEPGSNLETLTFDITVIDDEGAVLVEIEDFSQKRVNDAATKIRTATAGEFLPGRPPGGPAELAAVQQAAADRERQEMRAAEGVEALRRLLAWRPGPQVAVSVRDLHAVLAQADAAGQERILEETVRHQDAVTAHPRPSLSTPYAAPRNDTERIVAAAWQAMLGLDRVGVDDNFFELGGDSVQAIQIIASLRAAGLELTPQQFFQHQTVAELVAHAAPADRPAAAPADTPAAAPLPGLAPAELTRHGLDAEEVEDVYPLSPMQQGMLFHTLYSPGAGEYVEQVTWILEGELDDARLAAAWERVVAHHPALRTTFVWEDLEEPLQVVHRRLSLPLPRLEGPGEEGLAAWLEADRRRGFDLARGPLARLAILPADKGGHRLVWTYHHLLMDGWSAPLVLRDVALAFQALAQGEEPALPPARPYRDFIAWLRRQDRHQDPGAAETFWRRELAGLTPPEPLAPAVPDTAASYQTIRVTLPTADTDRLRAFARLHQVTLNTLVQGAWALLLARHGDSDDVVFGGVVSGRPAELPGAETMVGLFINTLPVRVPVPETAAPAAWLQELQTRQLAARSFEHTALPDLRRWLGWAPDQPLFDSILVFENLPETTAPEDGTAAGLLVPRDVARAAGRTGFPLTVEAFPGTGLLLDLTGDGRFTAGALERLAQHLRRLLSSLPAAAAAGHLLAEISPLSDAERRQLLEEWNPLQSLPWAGPLHRRFEEQAARRPGAPAVSCGNERLTYGELDLQADRLGRRLRGLGAGPESLVGILLAPSVDLVTAILAVHKAGAAYLPLDPEAPDERLHGLLRDGGSSLVVTSGALASRLPATAQAVLVECAGDAVEPLPSLPEPAPESLAYVIYTSGSTGQPKGVEVTHGNQARLFAAVRDTLAPGEDDVWTLFHSAAFDFSVWELWGALAHGGRLVVVPPGGSRDTEAFDALLHREGVTVLSQTPSAFDALLRLGAEPPASLRLVVFGGEALDPGRLAGWFERHGDAQPRLVNMYGITETTVHVTLLPLTAAGEGGAARPGTSPIGRPLPDLTVHLLDRGARLVPVGATGEIHVGGAGVARGYRGRPDLTAERFLPDPFAGAPGARLYRSGDLARRRPDGSLDSLGRLDHQVKIRGYRIEPAEIEAALLRQEGVADAAVEALGEAGDRRLVAFVVPRDGQTPAAEALRRALAAELPSYMVPAAFVLLDALPLTVNGKVDRRALAGLAAAGAAERESPFVPPSTPIEEQIAAIWRQVLDVDRVGARDSFFALGGHSLLAAQVIGRMRAAFHLDLPIRLLFEVPVLADLAARVEREPLERTGDAEPRPLTPLPHDGPQPLSFGQQQLWLVDQLAPGGSAYNIPAAVSLEGALDSGTLAGALAGALAGVVARHEVLRTSYRVIDGEPRQLVQDAAAVPLPLVDLSALNDGGHQVAEAARIAGAEHARPFDLERTPMLRAALLRLGQERHVLLLTLHHIAADGWSLGVLTRELGALYAGSPLPVLPVQYADFALHQRRRLQGETLEALTGWWRERLSPPPPTLPLPLDRPRQAMASSRGGRRTLELSRELEAALERLARQRGATLFAVLLAALQTLLARLTGEADIAVGTPVAGRDRPEVEPLIGYFVNVLVLRSHLPTDLPFTDAVERARQTSVAAWSHAELPFERLVDALEPERSLAITPFFQVLFTLQNAPLPRLDLPGLTLASVDLPPVEDAGEGAKFDLSLSVAPTGGAGLTLIATYRAALFDPPTVQRLLGTWATLLAGVAAAPEQRLSDLPLLAAAERHQLVNEWNDTASPVPLQPVHELFREQAARTPERPAFVDADGTTVTYRELAARAESLATELIRRGLQPEDRVALLLPNGLDFLTAVLGVLAAGGAYLPLDPDLPAERRDFIVADAGAAVVLPSPLGPAREDRREQGMPAGGPDSAAYVLYTSGSTGRPKGVTISHGALANFLTWVNRDLPGGTRPMPWISSPGFDAALKQFLAPLLRGDAVWLPAELAARPGATLNCVPSLWRVLLDEVQARPEPPSLDHLLLGGEAVDAQLVERTLAALPDVRIWNLYGPTETTSIAATGRLVPGRTAIGRPIRNARLLVLDRLLTPLPLGVAGELCIGGAGVARGYLHRPELTAERFVPDPFPETPGARLYRTGDRVRTLPDGALEFLGRLDRQVKLRGVRIELEEIESTLAALPEVRESAVVLRDDRLAAYLVADREKEIDGAAVRRFLEERLPAAMVPADLVLLPELPRTPSGKIDRRALPTPSPAGPVRRAAFEPPRTATEVRLAEVWRQVLGVEQVGLHDSFFELGGDSLLAVRVAARARQEGLPLDMGRIFQYTTILALAEALDEAPAEALPAPASSRGEEAPPRAGETVDEFPDAELSQRDLENLLARFER